MPGLKNQIFTFLWVENPSITRFVDLKLVFMMQGTRTAPKFVLSVLKSCGNPGFLVPFSQLLHAREQNGVGLLRAVLLLLPSNSADVY